MPTHKHTQKPQRSCDMSIIIRNGCIILLDNDREIVRNLVKKSFYGKRKKKVINVLTVFFISHKSDVKTFFN